MRLKKSKQGFFAAKTRKYLKRYLPTAPFSYKNIQEKLSMINVGGGCGEFVIINMNEIRRKINEI